MSARASCTTFVYPSICSSVPILLLLLLLPYHPVTCSTWPVAAVATDSPQSPDSPNSSNSPDSPQQVWKTSGAWKRVALCSGKFILSDHPGPSIQCAWKKRRICRHFLFSRVISAETSAICRYLLKFSFVFVQISAVFCHFLRKSALETKSGWHRGSQEPLFLRPCDHRSWQSRQFPTVFYEMR